MIRRISLVIVGAPKCATTSLLRYLAQHPELCSPSQIEFDYFLKPEEHERGWTAAHARYFARDPGPPAQLIAKRATMLYDAAALTRLAEHNPRVVVSALLRNPVDRAYSAYWFARLRGRQAPEPFEAAIATELAEGPFDSADREGPGGYLSTGVYSWHVRRLLSCLPNARVAPFTTDELAADPVEVCRALFTASDVDPDFKPQADVRHNTAARARSERVASVLASRTGAVGTLRRMAPDRLLDAARRIAPVLTDRPSEPEPMASRTRLELEQFFEPYNRELEAILGRPTGWS